jgi:hypothetical protein
MVLVLVLVLVVRLVFAICFNGQISEVFNASTLTGGEDVVKIFKLHGCDLLLQLEGPTSEVGDDTQWQHLLVVGHKK